MADFQQLLNNAIAAPQPTTEPSLFNFTSDGILSNPATDAAAAKKQAVATASAQKKQALGGADPYQAAAGLGNTMGINSASEKEHDLRTMNSGQLWQKYGDRTPELIRSMAQGIQEFGADQARTRNAAETGWDTVSGVGSGLVSGLGNIGALGVGLFSDRAGTALAGAVQQGADFIEGTQSDAVNAARKIQRTQSSLTSRDNAAQRQQEIAAGDNETIADLKRFGRDFIDTLGNSSDPTMLSQGTAEAAGSLLAGAPVTAGLRAIGSALIGGAVGRRAVGVAAEIDRGVGTLSGARALDTAARAGNAAAWPLATGLLEGGGTYSGTANEIMSMSFDDLEKNSPDFRALVAEGMSMEDARTTLASEAGQQAAAIQAPIGVATGFMTRALESPFQVPSVGSAIRQAAINEPVEESIQSATGQVAQNVAIRDRADETRSLSEGVGEASAQGALYGFTSAGAVQAPGAATKAAAAGGRLAYQGARAAVAGAVAAGKPLAQALVDRGDRIIRQQENASPVSESAINTVASDLTSNIDTAAQTLTEAVNSAPVDEQAKAAASEYVSSLVQSMRFDPAELDGMPDTMRQTLEGSGTRAEAVTRMARAVSQAQNDQDVLNNAAALWFLMEPMRALREADPVAFDAVPAGTPAADALKQYNWVINNIENNPTVQRALRAVENLMAGNQAEQVIRPVTEEALATPEGQQNVQNAIAVSALHPDKANLQANEQILTHAANGRLNLTPAQLQTLQASVSLLRARKKMEEAIAASGTRRAKDVVSSQIVAGNDPLRKIAKSALQHTQEILSAVRGQNNELAAARLEDFGKFVQHMQNKVGALNTHFENGNPNADGVQYQQLQPNAARDFKLSKDGMYVNTNKGSSIDQAQAIALEAEILADVYNGLVQTFPDLAQAEIPATRLNPALVGNAEELARNFRAPAPTPAPATVDGGIPTMITAAMRRQLREEGVSDAEIRLMTPADAWDRLQNPPAQAEAVPETTQESAPDEQPTAAARERNVEDTPVDQRSEQADPAPESAAEPVPTSEPEVNTAIGESVVGTKPVDSGNVVLKTPASTASRVTTEQAARLTDEQLNARIEAIQEKLMNGKATEADTATLTVLDAEMNERETAAVEAQQQEEAATTSLTAVPAPVDALYGGDKNFFRTSFTYPEAPRTRLYNEDSPIVAVRQALSSDLRLTSFLAGSSKRNTLDNATARAYQNLLNGPVASVLQGLEKNLRTFLDSKYSKSVPQTMEEIYLNDVQVPRRDGTVFSGSEMNRLARAKVLNLTELGADGKLTYQPQLLEQAALASMQWLLSADSFMSVMDHTDVSEMTGISETVLQNNGDLLESLTEGMSLTQAKRGLADKIRKYWGLSAKSTADLAYADGIPDAMAAEMIRAMEEAGLIEVSRIVLTPEQHGVPTRKDFIRILPVELQDAEQLAAFQDAIEVASMIEPEHTNFLGDDVPPVAQRQMNNPEVENTPAQKDALDKEQQTPFYVNPVMVSFFTSMGKDNLLSLFGTPLSDPDVYNDNDLKSVEGRNKSVTAAFDHMLAVVADVGNAAATASTSLDQLPIRYAYNMSRVGRMQMLGKYSPQASKLMREAILPTRSTLDLTTQEHLNAYALGMAQAMGIKVHNQPTEASVQQVMAMLNGPLKPAVDIASSWLSSTDLGSPTEVASEITPEQTQEMKKAFAAAGADLTMVSLHAVVDYARFLATDDKSSFTTPLYLEADGVTNGPINAMALMSIGSFTPAWVDNIAKGGLTFGPATSMADIRRTNTKDLYQSSTDAARERLSELRSSLSQDGNEQMDHLLGLMSLFNKDVLFDPDKQWEDGALVLKRGIAKNPLTITIYGSGEAGIAGKLTSNLVSEIYARMSQLLQARKANPNISVADAMFPNDVNAAAKLDRFGKAITALTTLTPSLENGALVWDQVSQPSRKFNPKTFSFTQGELEVMEKNMLELFVKPMRQGIADTVGEPLMKAVAVIRDAAQVQSIFLESMFTQEIDKKLAEKEKSDPNWRRGDFLSRKELGEISRSLQTIAPLVRTGDQSFMISGQQALELKGRDLQYGRALDDTLRTDPSVYAPAQAGVRAIPMMTIGMGDGMMMQLLAQAGLQGTLKIFDGMNMPLDKINEYSLQSNAAVYESWKGNPHKEVLKTFDKFIKRVNASSITEAMYPSLVQTLFTSDERRAAKKAGIEFSNEQIMERIGSLRNNLAWAAKSIDARHAAMDSLPMSVDQMAAAAQPYTNGVEATRTMSTDEAVAALNAAYQEAMKTGKAPAPATVSVAPVQSPVPAKTELAIDNIGRVDSTGVRVLSQTAMENLARSSAMTEAQKVVFDEVRRSGAAKDYTVVAGTEQQLAAYIQSKGMARPPLGNVHGWVSIGDKTIYVVNPQVETLVHELVHAASFKTVLAYYNGENLGTNGKEVGAAIVRLEAMMSDFLTMQDEQMDPALRAAYDSAHAAILSSNVESDQAVAQAKALNEFMAWGLTNEQLTKALKQKQAPALVRLAKGVVAAIKSLIWGRKVAPKVADDFLSNLQFNAGVVIRSQPSIGAVARDGELAHSTAYSNNRITQIRQAFTQKIADLLHSERWQKGVKTRSVEVSEAQMLAIDTAMEMNANGFSMTPEENMTFRMIVAALATEAEIDKNALARAQEIYSHVTKNLSVESFMADPNSTDPNERYYAQEKYNAVVGKTVGGFDSRGISTLLPAFLGLATVSDEFRAVLAKMPLPKSAKSTDGSLDGILENLGTDALDSLSRRLSGDVTSNNVKKSVDNLMEHIRKVAQDEQTYLDQYLEKSGGIIDRANEIVTNGLEAASDALLAKATAAEKNASNTLVRNTARLGQLFAAVVSEKNGAKVAEGVMAGLNSVKVWEPLRTFIGDLIGRTESNANVYDMIKAVRSAVQQSRQQFRDGVPQILNDKFKTKLTPAQWTSMFNVMGKIDLAVLRADMRHNEIADLITDTTARDAEINTLEGQIQAFDRRHWSLLQRKMKQLANYMNTGVPGVNLLRNVEAISLLLNEQKAVSYQVPNAQIKKAMDKLVTLYALESIPESDRVAVSSLVQNEADGVNFVLDYLVGQRTEEARKTQGVAKLNAYKGYIPSEQQAGVSMQVADDTEYASLRERGYVRVANYSGSSTEMGRGSKGYYFAPFSGRAVFNQGIMQNVRHTAGGVDATSGFTNGMTAGRITGKQQVARLLQRMNQETNLAEALMPVFDEFGVVVALERAVDPKITAKLNKSTDLARMIGVWRGRQAEEAMSQVYNEKLIDNLKAMYDEDMKVTSSNQAQYVNLLSSKVAKDNPVIADAVSLFTNETLAYIKDKFGDEFWVRKDMIRDAIGERSASVGDLWNGVTNLDKPSRDALRKALAGAFGLDAYRYMVKSEQVIQNFMADMRTLIVVKSVVVPAVNFVSNVFQLIGRGVPMVTIAKGMPAKLGEIDSYAKTRLRQIEAEAELRAVGSDLVKKRKLEAEIQSITDAHKRLSIWPLVQAGEFSSIADVGMQAEDLELTSGKLASFIERQVDKLPEGVRNAGRYALVTKDTALFRGLQKSVQYGDFIAKAVLFDDLVGRQKLSREQALARITEEFVNYDRLPGRFRSYLENMGLLWFYNFKIRSTKVALSTIRNNPVHALMAMTLPAPAFLGNIGSPITDNIAAKALTDTLGYSVGPDMGLRAPQLNPWMNLIN